MEQKNNTNMIKILGVIFVVIIVGIVGWQVVQGMNKNDNATLTNTQLEVTSGNQNREQARNRHRNGQYVAVGNYQSPAQREEIEITLSVTDGVVTGATFVGKATHPTSKIMQGKFSEGFEKSVMGKNIDELNLTVVNGSSLTPKGFMDALSKIKAEAGV